MYGMDSIAANPYLLKLGLSPQCKELTINSLIDSAEESKQPDESTPLSVAKLLNGEDGIFTADQIPKPSYYAYKSLQLLEGELIHWGKYHAVSRSPGVDGKSDSFCIVIFNQNEETENLCKRPSSKEETLEKINEFNDVLDISIHLNGLSGSYQIMKYRINVENCLLNYIAKSGFWRRAKKEEISLLTWLTSPKIDISTEEVTGSLYINTSLKGLESECIIITPM